MDRTHKSERRERKRFKRKNGMRVSGRSVLVLAGVKRKAGKKIIAKLAHLPEKKGS